MITILDIARMANVSKSTVSRVINNQPGVSKKTTDKVLQIIKETNFLPNKAARTLKSSQSNSILILFHRPSTVTDKNPFYFEIVSEVSIILEQAGYDIILQTYSDAASEIEMTKNKIANQFVKGIIILSSPMDESFLTEIDLLDVPTIVIGQISDLYKNIYSVDTDNYMDSYNLVQILINKGHTSIACIHPPTDVHVSTARLNGYLQCMKDNHLPIQKQLIIETAYSFEETLKDAEFLLNHRSNITAVFSTDAIRTLCVYKKMNEYGLSIPNDLSIIGFGSNFFTPFFTPEPSGIDIPIAALAEQSSKMLIKLISGEYSGEDKPKKVIVETTIHCTNSIKEIMS